MAVPQSPAVALPREFSPMKRGLKPHHVDPLPHACAPENFPDEEGTETLAAGAYPPRGSHPPTTNNTPYVVTFA